MQAKADNVSNGHKIHHYSKLHLLHAFSEVPELAEPQKPARLNDPGLNE
jgi:hypothetical protein